MSERFFLAAAPRHGGAVLTGDESRHLTRVLRAKVGDEVRVFDGSGAEWPARIARIGRDEVALDVGPPLPATAAPVRSLTLAVALPKGDRQKWLVEKLTELGTARLVPLVTARGVAEPTDAALGRLERGVIEACKQCGRNTLMEIGAAASLESLTASLPADTLRLIAHPDGMPLDAPSLVSRAGGVVVAVGPEGGFAPEELAAAERHGFERVSLGPHILRIETAAIALAANLVSRSAH